MGHPPRQPPCAAGAAKAGYRTALVAEVVTWGLAHYAECRLWLWVIGQNHRARRFYERLGAVDSGSELCVPPGGGERFVARRYTWATLESVRVGTRGIADAQRGRQR